MKKIISLTTMMLLVNTLSAAALNFKSIAVNCYQSNSKKEVEIDGVEIYVTKLGDQRSYPISCGNETSTANGVQYTIDKIFVPGKNAERVEITEQCNITVSRSQYLVISISEKNKLYTCILN